MNLLSIAGKSIRQRALASSLTALSVALGVTLMVSVLVIHGIVDRMFSQSATGYDLIIGPKGGRLQLVLNTVYRVSQPIENLPYRFFREIKDDARIDVAIPMALGDVTEKNGFPIVGTVPQYFTVEYMPGKKFRASAEGRLLREPLDAIIGSAVARKNKWEIGSKLKLVHGGTDDHIHDEEFTVVSVLAPTGTPNDKTVFIHLDGFYMMEGHDKPLDEALKRLMEFYPDDESIRTKLSQLGEAAPQDDQHAHGHGHHHHDVPEEQKEVTAILLQMKGKTDFQRVARMVSLSSELNEGVKAQAVNPVIEIKWLMDNVVGNVRTMIVLLTALIIAVSGVSIFVSIYNSMADRRREIAIMRALGASRQTVFSIVLAESALLCISGGVLGLLLGHGLVFVASPIVEARSGLLLDPFAFEPLELVLFPVLIVLASLIGFIPGLTAYRTDVAKTLAD